MIERVLARARIVTRDEVFVGSLRVEGGVITGLDEGPVAPRSAEDCEGDYLVPGVVELHTDVLERHARPRPGVAWPDVAAVVAHDAQLVSAGITTVLDSLAVGYVIDSGIRPRDPRPLIDAIRRAREAGALRAEHLLHLRCEISTEHVLQDFEPFAGDPMVQLVSLMDHTPGQRQFVSLAKYREYNQGRYGLSDAQMDALVAKRREDQARYGERHRAAIVALCQKHGHPLASHDDATCAHVEEAAQEGVVIAEFPTTGEAAAAARDFGMAILGGAPNVVCGGSHSGNIAAAELQMLGLLDIVSSDYVPASALHAAFCLHGRHAVPLTEAVAKVSATPARRVGLDDRGEIAPGQRADLVRVRLIGDVPVVRGVWRSGVRIG